MSQAGKLVPYLYGECVGHGRGGGGGGGGGGGLTITWWKATARARVQEGQKFYKHPLKQGWIEGGGGGGGDGAPPPNPENQFENGAKFLIVLASEIPFSDHREQFLNHLMQVDACSVMIPCYVHAWCPILVVDLKVSVAL